MWVSWYENGQKWKQGRFKKEKKVGKWITWNENGQIISERVYKKGEKI
jgi:antitoxin component YwqK of YwqJK toxin-antitoxin module